MQNIIDREAEPELAAAFTEKPGVPVDSEEVADRIIDKHPAVTQCLGPELVRRFVQRRVKWRLMARFR
jgi:hypothetical protein